MNIYVNKKETEFLEEMLSSGEFEALVPSKYREQYESFLEKVGKKPIDKNAVIVSYSLKGFTFKMDDGNSRLLMIGDKDNSNSYDSKKDFFRLQTTVDEWVELTNFLYKIVLFYQDKLQPIYFKPYSDSFTVYEKEVERSFDVRDCHISFNCYTGDENDDNWTFITRSRLKEVVRLAVTYIFILHPEKVYDLHEDISSLYEQWKMDYTLQS